MVLYLKSVVEKIVASGMKVTLVPVLDLGAVPIFFKVVTGLPPFSKRCLYITPSRVISTSSQLERALTTEEPTPWRPPDVL